MIEAVQNMHPALSFPGWLAHQCVRVIEACSRPLWWIATPVIWPFTLILSLFLWFVCAIGTRDWESRILTYVKKVREVVRASVPDGDMVADTEIGAHLKKQTEALYFYWSLKLQDYEDRMDDLKSLEDGFGFLFGLHRVLFKQSRKSQRRIEDALGALTDLHYEINERWPVSGADDSSVGADLLAFEETAEIYADQEFFGQMLESIKEFSRGETIPWEEARETLGL